MIIERPGYGVLPIPARRRGCAGCSGLRGYGAPVTEVTFDTPEVITASAPKQAVTGVWTASTDQQAGSSGVASDAEIAAAKKLSNLKWFGVSLAALVGLAWIAR